MHIARNGFIDDLFSAGKSEKKYVSDNFISVLAVAFWLFERHVCRRISYQQAGAYHRIIVSQYVFLI